MYIGPKFLVHLSFCSMVVNNVWFCSDYISSSINMNKSSVSFLTKHLHTPNMQPLGSLSILFNDRTKRYTPLNNWFFCHIIPQLYCLLSINVFTLSAYHCLGGEVYHQSLRSGKIQHFLTFIVDPCDHDAFES